MHLTELTIDGFGILSNLHLDDLRPGLNVVHGPNGSGKTTLLHFLRGVWCGFADARRRRLLPPLSGGHPGGSVEIDSGERRYHVARQALANQTDRLAVSVKRGTLDETSGIRGAIDALSTDHVHLLFHVGASEAHALDSLVAMAKADGISLQSQRRRSTKFDERLADVRHRRTTLLGGDDAPGETEHLRDLCRASAEELATLRQEADRLREQLAERYDEIRREIESRATRVEWLDLECQALQSNLIETEGRTVLSTTPVPAVSEDCIVVECHPHDELQKQVRSFDERIAHARTVLEDLARGRMNVSVQSAHIAGTAEIDLAAALEQQRSTLHALEQQALQLRSAAGNLSAAQACQCSQFDTEVQNSVQSMQQSIYLLCQQITRQEQAHRQSLLRGERSHLDRCEAELLEHVTRLQQERAQLLGEARHPEVAALRHATEVEAEACGCNEHHRFGDRTMQRVRVQVSPVPTEPVRLPDPRRPDWQRRLAELTSELDRAKAAWREAVSLQGEWDLERSRLILLERRMAEQQIEVDRRERVLNEKLEEGQSLLLVEAGLEKMRDSVFEDERAQVIAEASRYLARLTGERYRALQVMGDPLELAAVNDTGIAIPTHALSRGMLDQVGLSLRIALADEYARRGVSLPLVLDEVLSDSDHDRVDVAIGLLQEVAERRQVVFLTCQEHLAARFEAAGVEVRDFPGTHRPRTRSKTRISLEAREVTQPSVVVNAPAPLATVTAVASSETETATSVHSSEPHWLRVSSPIHMIPSIGEQMARRLSTAGVRTIGDLVKLDPEETDLPLDSLQITPAQWRIWRAEGRLLTCVPRLTGRDAQILAAVGVLLPQELAACDTDELVRKIDRLRGDGRSGWVVPGFVWPDRNIVSEWIARGRRARTFREASDSIGWRSRRTGGSRSSSSSSSSSRSSRRSANGRGRHFRVDQPSGQRGPRQRRRLGSRGRATALRGRRQRTEYERGDREPRESTDREHGSVHKFVSGSSSRGASERQSHSERHSSDSSRPLRFYLELQSPVVDAPSIGPTTARRLERVGVSTVSDLLSRDAQQLANRLQHRRINADNIRQWQAQSRLMCQVPELRGHDAQVLVACGLTDPAEVSRLSPQALFGIVGPFVATKEGQRLLRSSKTPDLAEVTDWISWAQQARSLKAA